VPPATQNQQKCLVIEKGNLCRIGEKPLEASDMAKTAERIAIFGILGIINVDGFNHLVVITAKQPVALLQGSAVFEITEVRLIPHFSS
jgi:hypothetical protein